MKKCLWALLLWWCVLHGQLLRWNFSFNDLFQDPELPQTLEELSVIEEEFIKIHQTGNDEYIIKIEFKPTAPHCSLATLIGKSDHRRVPTLCKTSQYFVRLCSFCLF